MNLEQDKLLIDSEKIPHHVAIIMDGNGRWAQSQGLPRVEGHRAGVQAVKTIVRAAGELGLKYLTLYTFSTENWNRPKSEVDALMTMMSEAIIRETKELLERNVRIRLLGNKNDLPESVRIKFDNLESESAHNTGLTLLLAISYGSRWEILEAVKKIASNYKTGEIKQLNDINEALMSENLTTSGIPDPDLLIRTSGECRLSNFLLWQCAYTEFSFVDKFWPDFGADDLANAVREYAGRERRFGKTGEQIKR